MARKQKKSAVVKFTYKLPLTETKSKTYKYYGLSQWNTCQRQEEPGEWRESTNAFFTQVELYRQKVTKVAINKALKSLRRKFKAAKLAFKETIYIENNKKWVLIQSAY